QVGLDHTERRSNRASRSTDGSQHHVPQAHPRPVTRLRCSRWLYARALGHRGHSIQVTGRTTLGRSLILRKVITMAKLVFSAITSLDGYIEDEDGNFDWGAPDRRCTASSMTWNDRWAPTFTGAGCTRRWSTGRLCRLLPTSRPAYGTSRSYGRQPTRSCTPSRWKPCQAPRRASSASSTRGGS